MARDEVYMFETQGCADHKVDTVMAGPDGDVVFDVPLSDTMGSTCTVTVALAASGIFL